MNRPEREELLAFVQLGDLHFSEERERNHGDALAILAQVQTHIGTAIDFVFLPGDNANNGLPSQYAMLATASRIVDRPLHVIPGDHDMEQGSLDAFYHVLGARALPYAETVRGVRCLFLDVSGPGTGGPDFRLGADQLAWLDGELAQATALHQRTVVAMHTFPDDLVGDGETEAVNALFAAHDVRLVVMGHTHYNEIADDGRTIFAATRSTGQIEEGPPGYAVITLDEGHVGWRFKPLDDPFPVVAITRPADRRLSPDTARCQPGPTLVRALVLGREPVDSAACRVGEGAWAAMTPDPDGRTWSATVDVPEAAVIPLTVRTLGPGRHPAEHVIEAPGVLAPSTPRHRDGSDADRIGAWRENGILGTRLGPNRNGRPW